MHHQMDKLKLLDMMQAEYDFVERTLAMMDDAQMVEPGAFGEWSVKDTLAHLAFWQRQCSAWIEAGQRGETPERPAPGYTWDDIDKLNDATYEADKGRALDDVLNDFRASYQRLRTLTASLPEAMLTELQYFKWMPEDIPLWLTVASNAHLHYLEHIEVVREWLKAKQAG